MSLAWQAIFVAGMTVGVVLGIVVQRLGMWVAVFKNEGDLRDHIRENHWPAYGKALELMEEENNGQ